MASPPPKDRHKERPRDATQLLLEWSRGQPEALAQLMPLVYNELHRLANRGLRRERPDHTLQPTALVHEVYLRLVDQRHAHWKNRAHFLAIAAQMMRRILVNYARHRHAAKRGAGAPKLSLDEALTSAAAPAVDLVALDEGLTRLAAMDAQQGRIIELRFFGGLTFKETAEVLGISSSVVKYDWGIARAWLHRQLLGGA